ncbi:hypothetical protein CLAFUW4_06997 [Fulvia fulva]|uniref:Uncharacterized protein n=1 Tax=Passalora fulva TaxID=5499 RepID=A0A9Q8UQU0_PASFU|nr:uncharacterized protein CLAFUR5_07133 [Fulvia fulva]KAK4621288.1 hypothetical protein CLAFUR4_07006 [Fulvia fulva]KAK4622757.1 hypothetical protein CLAFUR0_07004 [Fulvia fulva]UJO19104.1 hypothetical protein CLAFUR5_07133 [Fulvia fulva]WPV16271.1 hypothetical protein CLAFUW4_06997 [Fulvia fulva]WPV31581.1 hypothetical protein CLAFUW7_06997 [Fulvia fulva]
MSPSPSTTSASIPPSIALLAAFSILLLTYTTISFTLNFAYNILRLTRGCRERSDRVAIPISSLVFSLLWTVVCYINVREISELWTKSVLPLKVDGVVLTLGVVVLVGLRKFWKGYEGEGYEGEGQRRGEVLWRGGLKVERVQDHEKGF